MKDLAVIWQAAEYGKRELLRRDWPELADALDNFTIASHYHEAVKAIEGGLKIDMEAGLRDVLKKAGVPDEQIEKAVGCDGCRTIARLKRNLPPNDETAYYEFQRAARLHRKECPNR